MLRATPPGDSRLDPVAYATAATESRVFSSEHATVSELHLPDAVGCLPRGGIKCAIATTNTGNARAAPIQNRLVMSRSSALSRLRARRDRLQFQGHPALGTWAGMVLLDFRRIGQV